MVTVERARPGAKRFAARRVRRAPPEASAIAHQMDEWNLAAALETLSGAAPSADELKLLCEGHASLTLDGWEAQAHPAKHPEDRAPTLERAGHAAMIAALPPRRTIQASGFCSGLPTLEGHGDGLDRKAATLLGGPAAAGFGAGRFHDSPAELVAVTYLAAARAYRHDTDPAAALDRVCGLVARVLGGTWHRVEAVEEALRTGAPAAGILADLAKAHKFDLGDTKAEIELREYLQASTKYMRELARKLGSLSK